LPEHLLWEQGAAGSNPAAPTNTWLVLEGPTPRITPKVPGALGARSVCRCSRRQHLRRLRFLHARLSSLAARADREPDRLGGALPLRAKSSRWLVAARIQYRSPAQRDRQQTAGCAAHLHRRHQPVDAERDRKIYSPVRVCWGADHSAQDSPHDWREVGAQVSRPQTHHSKCLLCPQKRTGLALSGLIRFESTTVNVKVN
jgi:hypothetical protein